MDLISIFPALWTAGADIATGTTDLVPSVQDVVDTVGEEVKQTSSILSKIFQPILDKLPSLIFAVLFLLIGMFLIKQIMRILKRAFNRSNMDGIMSSFIRSVAKIILYVLLIVIALSILDVPMDSIVAVIASAGVAIGLALKDSLSNLAGGFIILFSKPLKEGDTIEALWARLRRSPSCIPVSSPWTTRRCSSPTAWSPAERSSTTPTRRHAGWI